MRARDGGSPSRVSSSANVKVTVDRNSNKPKWDSNVARELAVREDKATNSEILTLRATDQDKQVTMSIVSLYCHDGSVTGCCGPFKCYVKLFSGYLTPHLIVTLIMLYSTPS